MKKKLVLLVIPVLLLLLACTMSNTPTSKVEELFTKYQKLDNDIKNGIESVLDEQNLNESRKNRYRKILEEQYKNLTYQIKQEEIDGNNAIITVKIPLVTIATELIAPARVDISTAFDVPTA